MARHGAGRESAGEDSTSGTAKQRDADGRTLLVPGQTRTRQPAWVNGGLNRNAADNESFIAAPYLEPVDFHYVMVYLMAIRH